MPTVSPYPRPDFVGSSCALKVIFNEFCFRRIAAGVSLSLRPNTFGLKVIPLAALFLRMKFCV